MSPDSHAEGTSRAALCTFRPDSVLILTDDSSSPSVCPLDHTRHLHPDSKYHLPVCQPFLTSSSSRLVPQGTSGVAYTTPAAEGRMFSFITFLKVCVPWLRNVGSSGWISIDGWILDCVPQGSRNVYSSGWISIDSWKDR